MFLSENSLILAESDIFETLFEGAFIVVWLIIALVGAISKWLKKGKDDEEETAEALEFSSIEESEDAFENESEYGQVAPIQEPPPAPEIAPLDILLQQRREQAELARRQRWEAIRERIERENTIARECVVPPPLTRSKSVEAPKKLVKVNPAFAQTPAPEKTSNAPLAADILEDREALRRAVLAQEILSPPLALRD